MGVRMTHGQFESQRDYAFTTREMLNGKESSVDYTELGIDWEVPNITAEQLGKQRQEAHPQGTPRFFDDPNTEDIRGSLGELLFSNVYGFPVDTTIRPDGDGGIDFTTPIGIIDVKTALKPFNLLVKRKEINNPVDIYILVRDHGDGEASFVGWEYASVMKKCRFADVGKHGIISHYKSAKELHSMAEFDKLLEQGGK